jgi:hypothetical protein
MAINRVVLLSVAYNLLDDENYHRIQFLVKREISSPFSHGNVLTVDVDVLWMEGEVGGR